MIPKVLIIDDDQALRRLLEKEMEEYADFFSVVTAADGQEALQVLSDSDISVILSDLRMPGIDGFELMGLIIKQYPDIPVMAMTAYDKPKTKDVVMKSGAVDYLTKPVEGMGLFRRIMKILKKKDEGGSLNKVTLETYLQLVEMEEQTCTLRVRSQTAGKSGVLFFNNGRLMEARIGNLRGRDAAYEILSWSGVSLSIENECPITEKRIDGELQALLLDAMRSRDEIEDEDIHPEPDAAVQPERNNGAAADTGHSVGISGQTSKVADKKLSPVQSAEKKLITAMGTENGIQDVYSDPQSAALIARVESLGQLFESGVLSVIYMNQDDKQVLVVPDEENVVVMLEKKVSREGVIAVFA